ncbi:DUF2829 domain-containing protein [Brevibacillus laterosporus]|uniref:DUF2829 domain-containing protein n=1 Tax=Brevibacillus laterosporus TaxID=1465 RepID=UPI0006BDD6EF|nr:hypothetical protein AVT09_gp110 [Brevibacillus phage Sundance]ALA47926.1 hypothetical protein SUNDANCE_110 [Brevibacillus phage Sundance]
MNFGQALEVIKNGGKVAREGWNGKGMFIFLREGRTIQTTEGHMVEGTGKDFFESRAHICMRDAEGKCVVGWLASQTDILSEDWVVVN